ncbi:MAG: hypothetical protein UX87_C0008G0002 [Candidatus Amesbacteria bacterium GW2011_GWA1_47_16]|uniref:Uncharacterized protein n=5 Tax=Candidatus Amesiibacteriota TaxID=1752730 RepID=A0A1F4ZZ71_9BACT|nr:MAG: hypothetical protein UX86_C0013G0026 [Candidatus Amesbacteria bacterium GW2011_GWC1_47_15]KKU64404.1 MAG: hypothetical protein UX87_C0008G0002 [Candidatus Amesbacteria bacterium GW2011_GWA1_47_16]KKU97466.1 MAG: hypothetical protein UY28_C0020G0010 [Candidatus Amesbacteria bacterium GW2011_GWB1_48_13]OGC98110.1 MAG: hypothetical protein A2701_01645 [Candidatus Amesbacteria bacterium RIFCSPHIGHO2_01_FULL_47_34]OGD01867.1 MAG: hypothetical protein A2972_05255 [Candidatus Amesbacteria bact
MDKKIIAGFVLIVAIVLGGGIFLATRKTGTAAGITTEAGNEPEVLSSTGIHWHPKLEIYVKGEKIPLESDIGRKNSEQPIHTHDEDFLDGVIHLEFNGRVTPDQVLLGRFFDIWEKKFDWSEGKVIMTVNGEENTELKNYVMRHEDEIVLKFE